MAQAAEPTVTAESTHRYPDNDVGQAGDRQHRLRQRDPGDALAVGVPQTRRNGGDHHWRPP